MELHPDSPHAMGHLPLGHQPATASAKAAPRDAHPRRAHAACAWRRATTFTSAFHASPEVPEGCCRAAAMAFRRI